MSEYTEAIKNMTWSYSRLAAYHQCKLQWWLQYLYTSENGKPLTDQVSNIWAEYGSFQHLLLERLFKGEMTPTECLDAFVDDFDDALADFDDEKLKGKKFDAGLLYWQNMVDRFDDLMANMEILGVEKKVGFKYLGRKYTGRIDLLFRDKRDGALIVCDHKSAASVVGKKGQILKSEKKKLDGYIKQMALYSYPIIQEYGEEPKFWLWNFFNDGTTYKRPFSKKEMQDALDWSAETIDAVEQDETFVANKQFFYCSKLCDFRESCDERYSSD